MTVKTIFKVLIGTMAFMVISSLLIEIFNLQIVSLRLASLSRLAASQSAELFAQESYKDEGNKRSANLPNLLDADGNIFVYGTIYGSGSATDIWTNIYTQETYKQFSNDLGHNWYSLGIFDLALQTGGNASASLPSWGAIGSAQMEAYNKAMMANTYYDNMYTPLNIGIPYIGEYHKDGYSSSDNSDSVLDRAFKWNLTQLLSNCDPGNIHTDEAKTYVMFSGFRCYTQDAQITSVKYKVYDLKNPTDKSEFRRLTGINADNDGHSQGLAIGDTANLTALTASGEDERKNVCVAFIEYSLPVSYKGITPIKNIFEWVWTNEVEGTEDTAPVLVDQYWNDRAQTLTGGGRGSATLPTSGQLIYYVVR